MEVLLTIIRHNAATQPLDSQPMKPHGMLFKPDMILALLNTKPDVWPAEPIDPAKPFKWQTRRGINPQPEPKDGGFLYKGRYDSERLFTAMRCPHTVGQVIYARETFALLNVLGDEPNKERGDSFEPIYKATFTGCTKPKKWTPAIHMPKAIARLWFVVKRVRVERVNAISEADAKAEGIAASEKVEMKDGSPCYSIPYRILFDSINGKGSFDRGELVWVYDLARISP